MTAPAYRIGETYDWNDEHAPSPPRDLRIPAWPGAWDFCGMTIGSPLGVPAGPLLNSRWILYYAATAAMLNREIGIDIRDALARRPAVAAV